MYTQAIAIASLLAGSAFAAPSGNIKRAMMPYTENIPIHESCNATQRETLLRAQQEVVTLAQWGKDYVVTNGVNDTLYQKFFGTGDYVSVIGAIDSLISSNKMGMLLRCDNPDGNCGQEGWYGHWRGSNATSETVICPLSFTGREWLSEMCRNDYTVAGSSPSYFWASDLIHRMYHLPGLSHDEVTHVEGGDTYADCLNLAQTNGTWTPFNTHSIQYFLNEAYANEIAVPGQGCTGEVDPNAVGHSGSAATTTAVSGGTATATAAQSCHTHADGEIHCV